MTHATVLCVHGVACHFTNYDECWKQAIIPRDRTQDFEFIGLRWNTRYDNVPECQKCDDEADCSSTAFPAGWVRTQWKPGHTDGMLYFDLLEPGFRNEAIDKCGDAICAAATGKPLYVIAHSLGAVLVFQALQRLKGKVPINTLFTVGAPLAANIFGFSVPFFIRWQTALTDRTRLVQPVTSKIPRPTGIKNWVNLMDTEDFVYRFGQRRVSDEYDGVDEDLTESLHSGSCPNLDLGGTPQFPLNLVLNEESLCQHLYYFHKGSKAQDVLLRYMVAHE